MIYKASLKKTPTYRVASRNHLFQWDTAENKWNSKIYGATHAQETCSWDFHFIFNYKGKIVPYVQQRGARGGLPWQRITTWNLPAPSASAPISTHSPIWPGCSKGAMPRGPARRPARPGILVWAIWGWITAFLITTCAKGSRHTLNLTR